MKNQTIKRIARQINEAAQAIEDIDGDLLNALIENGCDIPMPQELRSLANRLESLLDRENGFASKAVAMQYYPEKAVWVNPQYVSFVP